MVIVSCQNDVHSPDCMISLHKKHTKWGIFFKNLQSEEHGVLYSSDCWIWLCLKELGIQDNNLQSEGYSDFI